MKRSSNSRVWNWARTRMATSSSEAAAREGASISSPTRRASSGPSQTPMTRTFSPSPRVGPQRLAEAAGVVGDQAVGGGEDVRGRAVILLEPDDLRAGEVLFEAQDVGDLRAAPGIDRLVVVADAAEVAARLGEQPQPVVLALVGVLIFVDEDVAEALAVGSSTSRCVRKMTSMWSRRSPKSQALSVLQARPDIARRARRRGRRRRLRTRRRRPAAGSSRGSSSGRSGRRAGARASASRRGRRRRSAA